MLGCVARWLRHARATNAAQAARERRMHEWAWRVPLRWSAERCPLCSAELATRAALAHEEASGPAAGPPDWLAAAELCALHERWLAALRPSGRRTITVPMVGTPASPCGVRSTGGTCRACPAPEPPCALCAIERRVTERAARGLVLRLTRLDARVAYAAGPGLCVRHFRDVAMLAPPEVRSFVADVLALRLETLHAELGEFFRKADYRYRHEPRGAEQTAWLRAIAQLVGPPELALPGTGLDNAC